MAGFITLFFSALCLVSLFKLVNARTLQQNPSPLPTDSETGDVRLILKKLLQSVNEKSCLKTSCKALQSDQTHANFHNFFVDLHVLLDNASLENLKTHFHKKGRTSTNTLFHFLLNATSPDEFDAFIHNTLSQPIHTELSRSKRGIISWLSEEASYLEHKAENLDWKTAAKRAGQVYTVIQAARSVSDPSQMVMQAGLAVGKIMLSEMVEEKLNEWWNEITG